MKTISSMATEQIRNIVKAHGPISMNKLSIKLLQENVGRDAGVTHFIRRWALKSENLRNIEGIKFDNETGTLRWNRKPTVTNPYYIGSSEMLSRREQCYAGDPMPKYAKHTLKDAIEEAERRLAADPTKDAISIVKIVAVVRRAKPVVAVDVEVVE